MELVRMQLSHLRSLLDVHIEVGPVTALVGRNGAGKSSVVRALQLFYTTGPRVTAEDFYARDTSKPIELELTWGNLLPAEIQEFGSHIQGDELTVTKVIEWRDGRAQERYYGSALQCEGFREVRAAASAKDRIAAFNTLVDEGRICGLDGKVRSGAAVDQAMATWESEHPDECSWARDDGQFFGFREVGKAKLERFWRVVHVPPVRDAEQYAQEGKDSPLAELMDVIVRRAIANREDVRNFRERVFREYKDIFAPEAMPELSILSEQLNGILQRYAPNAAATLVWEDAEPDLPLPKGRALLAEDGFKGEVARQGHGLQRAYIVSLLHLLASQTPPSPPDTDSETHSRGEPQDDTTVPLAPGLMLAIEEPELYQHPARQRVFSKVLHELAAAESSDGTRTQVTYTTHSPYFVDIARFHEVRAVRKETNPTDTDSPLVSKVTGSSIGCVAHMLEEAQAKPADSLSETSLGARLSSIITPMVNEGFFGDAVVLVEGRSDRAALLAQATVKGCDLDALGVVVVAVDGKNNLDRAYCVFAGLGIPCYVIFDADGDSRDGKEAQAQAQANCSLCRLAGNQPEDFPSTLVCDKMACFEINLETTIAQEVGKNIYDEHIEAVRKHYGYGRGDARKNQVLMVEVLRRAGEGGYVSKTLQQIVVRVIALVQATDGDAE